MYKLIVSTLGSYAEIFVLGASGGKFDRLSTAITWFSDPISNKIYVIDGDRDIILFGVISLAFIAKLHKNRINMEKYKLFKICKTKFTK